MPARVAHAPRGIPLELLVVKLRLCKPQYEVALGALVFVLFHAVAHAYGEALFLHVAENIIVFELGGIKIDVAARDIRIALFKEHLYHVDECIDAARRRNDDLRALDAKLFAVTEKSVGIELRNLHDGLVLAARALEHLVFAGVGIAGKVADVRDVHGAGHVIAEVAQGFFQHILHDVRAQVADVRIVVHGWAAGVHFDFAGFVRNKFFFFLCSCVIELHTGASFLLILLCFLCGQLAFFSAAAVQLAVQALNFKPHAAHFLRHRIGHVDLIQRTVVHHTLAAHAHDARRYTDRRCVIGYGIQHHGTRRHTSVITHAERPQHLCARTDEHVISKRRVTLALVFARAAERHTLIQRAVVTDNGGFVLRRARCEI